MSESRMPLYKLFTWIFLAALIGVYALYDWYTGTLNQKLAEQAAVLAETNQRMAESDKRLKSAVEIEHRLSNQASTAEAGLQAATERSEAAEAQIATLTKQVEQYQEDLATMTARAQEHQARIESMAAEHEGARKELTGRLEALHKGRADLETTQRAGQKRTLELEEEVARLKQTIAAADARYAAKAKRQEEHLDERLDVYRAALQGSEPERAAQVTELEQRVNEEHTALEQLTERQQAMLEQAAQAHKAAEEELTARLDAAKQQAEANAQALTAAEAAKQAQATELEEARTKLAAFTDEVQQGRDAITALEQKYEQQVAELRTELAQAGQTLAGVQEALSTAMAANTGQQGTHQEQLKAAEQRIVELEQDLAAAQSRHAQALAEERAKVEQSLAAEPKTAPPTQAPEPHAAPQAAPLAGIQTPELTERYAALKAKQTERGMLVILTDEQLHFQTGAAVMPKGKVPSLDRVGALLVAYPKLTARIEGYTDNSGTDQTNLALSKARAEAVRTVLIERGIAPERLDATGLGKQHPIAENGTAAGRRKNRRIEIYLIEAAP